MAKRLAISLGQYSDAGAKPENQDFHGAIIPDGNDLQTKGIAIAIADGISTSANGAAASSTAVKSFLTDYYCTPESWSVKTAGERVVSAANSWLFAQNGRVLSDSERERGHVTTFSALIVKSRTAHLFHVGDTRISRISGQSVEPLTTDHRLTLSSHESYLSRALGVEAAVEIDYARTSLQPHDIFLLTTDGIHDHLDNAVIIGTIAAHSSNLDESARILAQTALANGSTDNLTIQIVRIDALADGDVSDVSSRDNDLPPAPVLEPPAQFEGYDILRQLHASSRSHIYLARDSETETLVALKVPSIDMRGDARYLARFALEEWAARRVNNAHIIKAGTAIRPRQHIYSVAEYIEGTTLAQWMLDHPAASLTDMRAFVSQIATGLQALHRKEMCHQDLRPHNIMIDGNNVAKIIDLGSIWIAGVDEQANDLVTDEILGTHQYTAPERFLGAAPTSQADLYSLGVIAYQMLTGKLPYGTKVAAADSRAKQKKLKYRPAAASNEDIPAWVDAAIAKAVHPDPAQRYEYLSEFVFDLSNPNRQLQMPGKVPLLERNPVLKWQMLSAVLALLLAISLVWRN